MERAFSFGVLPSKYSGRGGAEMQGSRGLKKRSQDLWNIIALTTFSKPYLLSFLISSKNFAADVL